MQGSEHPSERLRFGVFEVDLRAGELRKHGLQIRLQEQPFQVLAILLEHGREVVTREELQKKLWSAEDRKSTRLNSSHVKISYAVFCLKKKKKKKNIRLQQNEQ